MIVLRAAGLFAKSHDHSFPFPPAVDPGAPFRSHLAFWYLHLSLRQTRTEMYGLGSRRSICKFKHDLLNARSQQGHGLIPCGVMAGANLHTRTAKGIRLRKDATVATAGNFGSGQCLDLSSLLLSLFKVPSCYSFSQYLQRCSRSQIHALMCSLKSV